MEWLLLLMRAAGPQLTLFRARALRVLRCAAFDTQLCAQHPSPSVCWPAAAVFVQTPRGVELASSRRVFRTPTHQARCWSPRRTAGRCTSTSSRVSASCYCCSCL